jgi:hypothetical protein
LRGVVHSDEPFKKNLPKIIIYLAGAKLGSALAWLRVNLAVIQNLGLTLFRLCWHGGEGRVAQICKRFLWIYSNKVIPFYYIRVNTNKNS